MDHVKTDGIVSFTTWPKQTWWFKRPVPVIYNSPFILHSQSFMGGLRLRCNNAVDDYFYILDYSCPKGWLKLKTAEIAIKIAISFLKTSWHLFPFKFTLLHPTRDSVLTLCLSKPSIMLLIHLWEHDIQRHLARDWDWKWVKGSGMLILMERCSWSQDTGGKAVSREMVCEIKKGDIWRVKLNSQLCLHHWDLIVSHKYIVSLNFQ